MHKITFENQSLRAKGIRILTGDKNAELTMHGIRMGEFQNGIYSFQEQLQEARRREKAWGEALKIDNQARPNPAITQAQLFLIIISGCPPMTFENPGNPTDECWNVIPPHRVDGFYTTTPVVAEFF